MTSPLDKFSAAMQQLPLVAILRGLTPAEAPAVGDAIVEAGFRLLEVPLIRRSRSRASRSCAGAFRMRWWAPARCSMCSRCARCMRPAAS